MKLIDYLPRWFFKVCIEKTLIAEQDSFLLGRNLNFVNNFFNVELLCPNGLGDTNTLFFQNSKVVMFKLNYNHSLVRKFTSVVLDKQYNSKPISIYNVS